MVLSVFTPATAKAAIPQLEALIRKARNATAGMRDARDQLVDLRIVWGDKVETDACPDRKEYEDYKQVFSNHDAALHRVVRAIDTLGCELKDVENGLVDFHARRGDALVYLCWKSGETGIEWWHTQEGGFGARRPLEQF